MNGNVVLERPDACSGSQRADFERLVRAGFDGSDSGLPDRILRARKLAFYYPNEATIAAIAGLKVPDPRYRAETFEKAGVGDDPSDYELELGWVFVEPALRGYRLGSALCERLMVEVPEVGFMATTRSDNRTMQKILAALGFERAGRPYPRRAEELVLYLRRRPANP